MNEPTGRALSRRTLIGGAVAAGAAGTGVAAATMGDEQPFRPIQRQVPDKQPNFLVILGDDMGWGDLSSYGAPTIRTPHLDGLAASGIRFTDGYSASSVCSPTRFGLYTGRYPGRLHGGLAEPLAEKNEIDGIPKDHPTLASLLKGVGYDTAMFGKWHCGFLPFFSPTRVGWDQFFGNFGGAVDYFSKIGTDGVPDLYEGEVEVEDLRYYTHVLTERAVEFITQPHPRPWLVNLNFTTPHWPWEGPDDRAVSDDLTRRVIADDGMLAHFDGGSLDVYRAMVEDLDRSVGKVLAALNQSRQRNETVVLFASDNGGERFSYMWPFTGGKWTLNEGGIRVPTILSWPGTLPAGRVSSEPVITMDWTATLVELAGAQPGRRFPLDGTSLVPYLLGGRELAQRPLFWRMRDWRALRDGTLKYLRTDDETDHLYDLSVDAHEQADLGELRPTDLDRLRRTWERIGSSQLAYD